MRISIITVCYNAEDTIEQTIRSVVQQTYTNIEYIIVDGHSKDGTMDIVHSYDAQISTIISEDDNGIYDAMNKGIRVATGDYIQFLGADDCLVDPYTIERVCNAICDDTDVFSAPCIAVNEKYHCEIVIESRDGEGRDHIVLPKLPHQGIFVKRDLLKKKEFDITYQLAADFKLLLTLYFKEQAKFQFVDFPVTYYSLGGASSQYEVRVEVEDIRILEELALMNHIRLPSRHYVRVTLKRFARNTLDALNLWGWFLCTFKKWKQHHCTWEHCRWCKRS